MRSLFTRRALKDERGFMIVEVAIGSGLIVLALLGLISVLDSKRELVSSSEHRETALHRAELEIEKIRAVDYADLELPSAPTSSTDPNDPDYHVNGAGTGYRPEHLVSSSTYETLVIDTTCTSCLVRESTFADGDLTGTVHRYATWNDSDADGVNDLKRVTIAVRLDQGGERPVTLSTIVREDT